MRVVPTRQGTHLPQLSSAVNLRKNLAKSTMQVLSSTTTMPPEPIMEPCGDEALEVDRRVEQVGGQAAAATARRAARP